MKLKLIKLLTILIPFLYGNCTKDSATITISGITERDIMGNSIGNIDPTDWKITDTWTSFEESLFKKNNSTNTATDPVPNTSIGAAGYPNPVTTLKYLAFNLLPNMYYDIRIIDHNLNIKAQFDSLKYRGIDINDSAFFKNELYRVYYKIYSGDKVYRGHGDFVFIR